MSSMYMIGAAGLKASQVGASFTPSMSEVFSLKLNATARFGFQVRRRCRPSAD
jgi:hypothetical protein